MNKLFNIKDEFSILAGTLKEFEQDLEKEFDLKAKDRLKGMIKHTLNEIDDLLDQYNKEI